jgi:hypothetical protein
VEPNLSYGGGTVKITLVQIFDDNDYGNDPLVERVFVGHRAGDDPEVEIWARHALSELVPDDDRRVDEAMDETTTAWRNKWMILEAPGEGSDE